MQLPTPFNDLGELPRPHVIVWDIWPSVLLYGRQVVKGEQTLGIGQKKTHSEQGA